MFEHAASDYTAHEMLLAYIAERFETLADRMVARGLRRLGLFGGRDHAAWLATHIDAMRTLPFVAFVDRPDVSGGTLDLGVPVYRIGDPRLVTDIDCLLIGDDRFEDDLTALAHHHLPIGTLVCGLYGRLGVGAEPLPGEHVLSGSQVESKSAQGLLVPAASDASARLNTLTGATLG